jgi:hypothetical protein
MKYFRALILLLVGVSLLYAGEPWKSKSPDKWTQDDVNGILKDSPWGKVVPTRFETQKEKDKTAESGQGSRTTSPFDRGESAGSKVPVEFARVTWWSARTPRRAMVRMVDLKGFRMDAEAAKKFSETPMEHHVITIEASPGMMDAASKLEPEVLNKAAWLEIPGQKRRVECVGAGVVKNSQGKLERIRFHFPRQVDGQPLITANEKKVIFKWKLPDNLKVKLEDAQIFEATFEPKKMVVGGELDN